VVAPIVFSFFSFATTAAIKCCQCFIFRRISNFVDAITVQVSIVWHENRPTFRRPIISADFYRSCVVGLSRNKGWASKWTRRWKTNLEESSRSQSWRWLTNKTAFKSNCTRNYLQKQISDITFHRETGLQIRPICLQLKTVEALWLLLFMPAQSRRHWQHSNVVLGNLGYQFLWPLEKNLIGSMPDRLKAVIRNKGHSVLY